MTKFKGLLSKRLENDVNYPGAHLGAFPDHGHGVQSWQKSHSYSPPSTHLHDISRPAPHSTQPPYPAQARVGEEEDDDEGEEDNSVSSPIMDLTTSMGSSGNGSDPRERSPRNNSGYSDSTGSDVSTVNQMLGYSDHHHHHHHQDMRQAIKMPSSISIAYRQPWENQTQGHPVGQSMPGLPSGQTMESHLSSPTSSAFTSNSDSTASTLVLASLKKRKRKPQPIPDDSKDDAYWERRKRNNESAKRSREMRRIKEQQTTMRVIYLEQENLRLKTETDMLRSELEKLREMVYNRNSFGQNGV